MMGNKLLTYPTIRSSSWKILLIGSAWTIDQNLYCHTTPRTRIYSWFDILLFFIYLIMLNSSIYIFFKYYFTEHILFYWTRNKEFCCWNVWYNIYVGGEFVWCLCTILGDLSCSGAGLKSGGGRRNQIQPSCGLDTKLPDKEDTGNPKERRRGIHGVPRRSELVYNLYKKQSTERHCNWQFPFSS